VGFGLPRVLTFSGVYMMARLHLLSWDLLVNTGYGRLLLLKLVLVAAIVILTALHCFVLGPRAAAGEVSPSAVRAVARSSAVLTVVVPVIGVLLGALTGPALREQVVQGQHEHEADDQREGGEPLVTFGMALGDELVRDDVEHRSCGERESERQQDSYCSERSERSERRGGLDGTCRGRDRRGSLPFTRNCEQGSPGGEAFGDVLDPDGERDRDTQL